MCIAQEESEPWTVALSSFPTRVDSAGHDQELFAGTDFELMPQRVRASEKRHVIRMLGIREANNSALTVRGAELVRNIEALDAEDAQPAARQVIHRGAAHATYAEHDDVVSHDFSALNHRGPP